jgi:hypothetical protein
MATSFPLYDLIFSVTYYSRKRYTSDAIDCELFPTAAMMASSPIDMLARPMTQCGFCRAAALSARALYR